MGQQPGSHVCTPEGAFPLCTPRATCSLEGEAIGSQVLDVEAAFAEGEPLRGKRVLTNAYTPVQDRGKPPASTMDAPMQYPNLLGSRQPVGKSASKDPLAAANALQELPPLWFGPMPMPRAQKPDEGASSETPRSGYGADWCCGRTKDSSRPLTPRRQPKRCTTQDLGQEAKPLQMDDTPSRGSTMSTTSGGDADNAAWTPASTRSSASEGTTSGTAGATEEAMQVERTSKPASAPSFIAGDAPPCPEPLSSERLAADVECPPGVRFSLTLRSLDYQDLRHRPAVYTAYCAAVQKNIAAACGVEELHVQVSCSAASSASASGGPPPGSSGLHVQAVVSKLGRHPISAATLQALASDLTEDLNNLESIDQVLCGRLQITGADIGFADESDPTQLILEAPAVAARCAKAPPRTTHKSAPPSAELAASSQRLQAVLADEALGYENRKAERGGLTESELFHFERVLDYHDSLQELQASNDVDTAVSPASPRAAFRKTQSAHALRSFHKASPWAAARSAADMAHVRTRSSSYVQAQHDAALNGEHPVDAEYRRMRVREAARWIDAHLKDEGVPSHRPLSTERTSLRQSMVAHRQQSRSW
eukprot:TRINITY_DN69785_c0_g1_i2.p1 TRINITY_DN69785_c0_g1~~TRINITY_DN69785_c0_g1_i2.p1  ORF type:complete len:619 (-),score=84.49 TRINITY_DN69785_c0_g1_i2:233-2014(-)